MIASDSSANVGVGLATSEAMIEQMPADTFRSSGYGISIGLMSWK
jgi:hypothetical protein